MGTLTVWRTIWRDRIKAVGKLLGPTDHFYTGIEGCHVLSKSVKAVETRVYNNHDHNFLRSKFEVPRSTFVGKLTVYTKESFIQKLFTKYSLSARQASEEDVASTALFITLLLPCNLVWAQHAIAIPRCRLLSFFWSVSWVAPYMLDECLLPRLAGSCRSRQTLFSKVQPRLQIPSIEHWWLRALEKRRSQALLVSYPQWSSS